jgi:hypothetical protein
MAIVKWIECYPSLCISRMFISVLIGPIHIVSTIALFLDTVAFRRTVVTGICGIFVVPELAIVIRKFPKVNCPLPLSTELSFIHRDYLCTADPHQFI